MERAVLEGSFLFFVSWPDLKNEEGSQDRLIFPLFLIGAGTALIGLREDAGRIHALLVRPFGEKRGYVRLFEEELAGIGPLGIDEAVEKKNERFSRPFIA